MLQFIKTNKRLLNFGFLFNFFSSFGQTFFISIFVPYWIISFELNKASFGYLYTALTLTSALLLSVFGRYVDRLAIRTFAAIVFSALLVAVVSLSFAQTFFHFALSLFFVRWLGQGLMTHTANTGIARHFSSERGRALGLTLLGHPAGQFALPIIIVWLIDIHGWRNSLHYAVLGASVIVIPALFMLRKTSAHMPVTRSGEKLSKSRKRDLFLSPTFWIIGVNMAFIPLFSTALFLYQFVLAETRGWSASQVAFSFIFYSVAGAISMVSAGPLVDRYSARFFFPLYLAPLFIALILLGFIQAWVVLPFFYAVLGFVTGFGSTLKGALLAEIYGTAELGRIRGFFSTVMVFSTALGPPVLGYALDREIPFLFIALFFAVLTIVVIALSSALRVPEPRNDRA